MKDFAVLGLVLVALWGMWLIGGGPNKYESTAGPFIKPLAPLDTGEIYGPTDSWFWGDNNSNGNGQGNFDPTALPANWQPVNTKYFLTYIPATWRYEVRQLDDKYIGKFIGPETTLAFEFGENVNTLAQSDDPGYIFKYDKIGTYKVKLLKPTGERSGTTGAYYSKTFKKYKLAIFGENLKTAEQKTAFTIFYNVRFKLNP